MEVARGETVVPRAVGRAFTQNGNVITISAPRDVTVQRIVQSGIGDPHIQDASPLTNAQVRINGDELDGRFLGALSDCYSLALTVNRSKLKCRQ